MNYEEACIDAIISEDQHPNKDEAINSMKHFYEKVEVVDFHEDK